MATCLNAENVVYGHSICGVAWNIAGIGWDWAAEFFQLINQRAIFALRWRALLRSA